MEQIIWLAPDLKEILISQLEEMKEQNLDDYLIEFLDYTRSGDNLELTN